MENLWLLGYSHQSSNHRPRFEFLAGGDFSFAEENGTAKHARVAPQSHRNQRELDFEGVIPQGICVLAHQGYIARIALNFVFRVLEGGIVNVHTAHDQFIVDATVPQFGLVG